MAQLAGFNFIDMRATAGFVTDDPADNYSLGGTTASRTLPGPIGLTYAWNSGAASSGVDVSAGLDTRLAGRISNSGSGQLVISGLTAGHTYEVKGAWGYEGFAASTGFTMYHGNNAGGAIVVDSVLGGNIEFTATTMATTSLMDARGNIHASFAAWLAAAGSAATFVPTGTEVCFFRHSGGTAQHVRCIGFRDPSAGGGGGSKPGFTLLGVG